MSDYVIPEMQAGMPRVCFSGTFRRDRQYMHVQANEMGWLIVGWPREKPDVVVVGSDTDGVTAKEKAARKYGIAVITEEQWPSVMLTGEIPRDTGGR